MQVSKLSGSIVTTLNDWVHYFLFCSLQFGPWHAADEYDGQVREITFRSVCHSPMCPPDSAMTEWQHAVLSADKTTLVYNDQVKQLIF